MMTSSSILINISTNLLLPLLLLTQPLLLFSLYDSHVDAMMHVYFLNSPHGLLNSIARNRSGDSRSISGEEVELSSIVRLDKVRMLYVSFKWELF